jgi:hypothetical protein
VNLFFDSYAGEPTQQEIEGRAYERWEQAGKPQGWTMSSIGRPSKSYVIKRLEASALMRQN